MSFLIQAFNLILYQPILNALILLYHYLPGQDFGVAIIVLTLLIRALLYPLSRQAIISQKAMTDLQPKIKEIQKKYKKDREGLAKATMNLYKEEKINPFSGCLPFLIQIPILIALFQVFSRGFGQDQIGFLYDFVPSPLNGFVPSFLGLVNLSQPNFILAIIAGFLQFWQTKMLSPKTKKTGNKKDGQSVFLELFQKQMLYLFPVFTFMILLGFPSALALFWAVTSLFVIGQQHFFLKTKKNAKPI